MTIDQSVNKALRDHPCLSQHLDLYAQTKHKTYAMMIDIDLQMIKQYYGNDVYQKFNHIYQAIQR